MKKKVKKEAKGVKEEKKVQWSPKMFIFTLLHYFTRHMQFDMIKWCTCQFELSQMWRIFVSSWLEFPKMSWQLPTNFQSLLNAGKHIWSCSDNFPTFLNTFQWLLNVLKTPTSLSTICLKIFGKYLIWMLFKHCTIWNWNLEKPN